MPQHLRRRVTPQERLLLSPTLDAKKQISQNPWQVRFRLFAEAHALLVSRSSLLRPKARAPSLLSIMQRAHLKATPSKFSPTQLSLLFLLWALPKAKVKRCSPKLKLALLSTLP